MPFDAFDAHVRDRDQLAELSIVPVAMTVLEQHKLAMLRRYGGLWRTLVLTPEKLPKALRRFHAPRRVRRLAERLGEAHPEATFHLGWLDSDPYLNVRLEDGLHCLAIWMHRFRTVAIAEHPPLRRRWWW
jgi:hypothetical protein